MNFLPEKFLSVVKSTKILQKEINSLNIPVVLSIDIYPIHIPKSMFVDLKFSTFEIKS